jgi:glycosyltransferase involved in cell wall biosynthesis
VPNWKKEVRLIILAEPRAKPGTIGRRLYRERYRTREKANRVDDDFPDQEKASIFDAFNIFAMPSTGESFGIACVEAWMLRKAVIGEQIGPTRCVIDEGPMSARGSSTNDLLDRGTAVRSSKAKENGSSGARQSDRPVHVG